MPAVSLGGEWWSEQEAVRIRQVRVEGNQRVETETILNQVDSREGTVFNEKMIAEDARRIVNMSQIAHVDWRGVIAGNQIDITFVVEETALLQSVELTGNKKLKEKDLLKKLNLSGDDFLDDYLIGLGAESLEEYYHEKGYYFAQVRVEKEFVDPEWRVIYKIYEGPRLRIKEVHFENRRSFSRGKLKSKIKSRSYFPILSKGHLDDAKLRLDCLALEVFYHDEGFLDAQVFAEKEFNEDQRRVEITFVIEEGAPYRLKDIRFEGNRELSEGQLLEAQQLEPGQILKKKHRDSALLAVERSYGKEGYIYAVVVLEPEYTDQEGEVNAVFKIRENDQYYLGRLLIQGNTKTQDKVIRRAYDYYGFLPGGLYNTEAKDRGTDQLLFGTRFFESVNVTPFEGGVPNERDALVSVMEADTGQLAFGVGVDTNSGVMGIFTFAQQNFDAARPPQSVGELLSGAAFTGGGQRLSLRFSPGSRLTTGGLNFHEPYLFDQPYYMDLDLMLFRRWWEAYLETKRGGRITLGHRFESGLSADVSLRAEDVLVWNLDDPAPPEVEEVKGNNFLTGVQFGLGYRKTDNLYRPNDGYRFHAAWEQVGALGGEFNYGKASAGATLYRTVYTDMLERKTVWSGNIRGNHIFGAAPVFEKYYAGGIGTIRGFDYRGVSPRSVVYNEKTGKVKHYPIGSDYMLLAGMELTHPFYEDVIYGKIFCDSGMVSEGPYRVTVGFGVELVIPQMFIPMQFNFGFPILKDDKDEKEMFSFTLGVTF